VKVEVVNEQGRVVRSATTEYDGFYVISNIPLGSYSVRVSPAQLSELGLQSEGGLSLVLTAKDQFKSAVDFNLLVTNDDIAQ